MKKLIIMLAMVFLIFLGSAPAMAVPYYGIHVGDQVMATSAGPAIWGMRGGELSMVDITNGYGWISYCVETSESIWLNNPDYVGDIQINAVRGGEPAGFDPLDDRTAWLYWSGYTGTLLGYNSNTESQQDVQGLIWYLEGEVTEAFYQDNKTSGMEAWLADAEAAVAAGWTNNERVMVANLYNNYNSCTDTYSVYRQDVLVPNIPEPATMLLLGTGLIGLAFLGRKKLFKK